jgi:hypothetical protein
MQRRKRRQRYVKRKFCGGDEGRGFDWGRTNLQTFQRILQQHTSLEREPNPQTDVSSVIIFKSEAEGTHP